MSLRDLFNRSASGKKVEPGAASSSVSDCPREADLLAYIQNRLSPRDRRQVEKHLANCDNCRELLADFSRNFEGEDEDSRLASTPLSEDEVKKQTIRLLGVIQEEDLEGRRETATRGARSPSKRNGKSSRFSYPMIAAAVLIFCAAGVVAVLLLTGGPSAEEAAEQALALAMKDGRRSPARISGHLPYSEWSMAESSDSHSGDAQLEAALAKLSAAEYPSAPIKSRHLLARVHLAFYTSEHANKALAILEELHERGLQSAEFFNDLGVAQFELGDYDRAIESFSKALSISESYGEALFNRAVANNQAGRFNEARRDWQLFINMAPDDQWKVEAERKLKSLRKATHGSQRDCVHALTLA